MLKYIVKSTNDVRVSTEEDADALHKQMNEEAMKLGAVLTNWTETKKEIKSKNEIIDEYFLCRYTFTFGTPKDTTVVLKSIDYNLGGEFNEPFDGGTVISGF